MLERMVTYLYCSCAYMILTACAAMGVVQTPFCSAMQMMVSNAQESCRCRARIEAHERGNAGFPQDLLWLGSRQTGDVLNKLCCC